MSSFHGIVSFVADLVEIDRREELKEKPPVMEHTPHEDVRDIMRDLVKEDKPRVIHIEN